MILLVGQDKHPTHKNTCSEIFEEQINRGKSWKWMADYICATLLLESRAGLKKHAAWQSHQNPKTGYVVIQSNKQHQVAGN